MTIHSEHTALVISASRRGPMLYVFCRDKGCRHRIVKTTEMIVSGVPLKADFAKIGGPCEHPKVVLKRAAHFNISATCQACNKTITTRNVFIENKHIFWPEAGWSKTGNLGDSMLPIGDSRLL